MNASDRPAPLAAGAAADAAAQAMLKVMTPLARMAIDHGLQFRAMEELLKQAMIEAARAASAQSRDPVPSVSRVSVITGINRQEVKRLMSARRAHVDPAIRSRTSEVFIRWTTDPAWLDESGVPRALPRRFDRDDQPSFEKLALSVTRDVHPRTLLDELLRLELVEYDRREDTVAVRRALYVPVGHVAESLAFLGDNVGDHLSAARANVTSAARSAPDGGTTSTPFLEQSLYADELCAESALEGARHASSTWRTVSRELAQRLQALELGDRTARRPSTHRIRIGMYCYTAPLGEIPAAGNAAGNDEEGQA